MTGIKEEQKELSSYSGDRGQTSGRAPGTGGQALLRQSNLRSPAALVARLALALRSLAKGGELLAKPGLMAPP